MSDWKCTDKPAQIAVKTSTERYIPIPRYAGQAIAIFGRHTGTGDVATIFETAVKNMVPYNGTTRIPGFSDLGPTLLSSLSRIYSRRRDGDVDGEFTDPIGVDGVEKTFCYIIYLNHDWRQYENPMMYIRHEQNAALTAFSGSIFISVLPGDVLKSEVWQYHSHDSLKNHEVLFSDDVMLEEVFVRFENAKGGTNLLNMVLPGKDKQRDIDVNSVWDAMPHAQAFPKRWYTGAAMDEDDLYFTDLMNMPHKDRKLTALLTAAGTAIYWATAVRSASIALSDNDAGARSRGNGATQVEPITTLSPVSMPDWPTPTAIRTGVRPSRKPGRR
jgi:hypothetical protein